VAFAIFRPAMDVDPLDEWRSVTFADSTVGVQAQYGAPPPHRVRQTRGSRLNPLLLIRLTAFAILRALPSGMRHLRWCPSSIK
jgi:hypothetical protein